MQRQSNIILQKFCSINKLQTNKVSKLPYATNMLDSDVKTGTGELTVF
jgi:hypothetical protein